MSADRPDEEVILPLDEARVAALRAEVAAYKHTMQSTRRALHRAAAQLETLEAELRRRGVGLELRPRPGAEETHGRPHPRSQHRP